MAAGEILNLLVRSNLAAGAAIVLVAVVRKAVRMVVGARLAYGLWLLPLLAASAVMISARQIVIRLAAPISQAASLPVAGPIISVAPQAPPSLDPDLLILAAWLAGVAACAVVMVWLQRRFVAEAGKGLIGPAVVGLIAPRIVTPHDFENKFNDEERGLVLAHEQAHIARQDSRLNGLSAAIQCLCWFNPLVHLAAHLARIDQELACDEAVVTRFPDARRAYAQALVKAQLAIRPLPLGCYWPSGTEHPLHERIAMLTLNDFSRTRRIAGASSLALLCAATGFAAWASQPAQVSYRAAAPTQGGFAVPSAIGASTDATTPGLRPARSPQPAAVETGHEAVQLAQASPAPQPPVAAGVAGPQVAFGYGGTIQNALTDAEARGQAVSVEGTIKMVQWVNPQAMITLTGADGQDIVVASQTPNSLLRSGINRDALKPGTPIRADGYRGADGSIQVRVTGFSSNGRPLAVNDPTTGQPLSGQAGPAAVVSTSTFTNSVIREGDPQAPRP